MKTISIQRAYNKILNVNIAINWKLWKWQKVRQFTQPIEILGQSAPFPAGALLTGPGYQGASNTGNNGGNNAGNTGGNNAGNTGGTNAGNNVGNNAGNTGGNNAGNNAGNGGG